MEPPAGYAALFSFSFAYFIMDLFHRVFGLGGPILIALLLSWTICMFVPMWRLWRSEQKARWKMDELTQRNRDLASEKAELEEELAALRQAA